MNCIFRKMARLARGLRCLLLASFAGIAYSSQQKGRASMYPELPPGGFRMNQPADWPSLETLFGSGSRVFEDLVSKLTQVEPAGDDSSTEWDSVGDNSVSSEEPEYEEKRTGPLRTPCSTNTRNKLDVVNNTQAPAKFEPGPQKLQKSLDVGRLTTDAVPKAMQILDSIPEPSIPKRAAEVELAGDSQANVTTKLEPGLLHTFILISLSTRSILAITCSA